MSGRKGFMGKAPDTVALSSNIDVIHRARVNDYGDGVAHGFETTLRLLLGESVDGAPAFTGPLTPECEAWARAALSRLSQPEDAE